MYGLNMKYTFTQNYHKRTVPDYGRPNPDMKVHNQLLSKLSPRCNISLFQPPFLVGVQLSIAAQN